MKNLEPSLCLYKYIFFWVGSEANHEKIKIKMVHIKGMTEFVDLREICFTKIQYVDY